MAEERSNSKFYFVGSYLCLDFVNTEVVADGEPVDLLRSFTDLVKWSVEAGVFDAAQAKELTKEWDGEREAERAFEQGKEFRVALREMVNRVVEGKSVQQSTVARINEVLQHKIGVAQVVRVRNGYEKHFHASFSEPVHLLVPIAESAADFLCEADRSLLKKCENPACVLFFYDTTKNHARRWCSMSACGNRAKVAAHYRRARSSNSMVRA